MKIPAPSSFVTRWRARILCGALLLAALVASRLPLTPRYLVTFDEINFALSIEKFSPAAHQPQPPGYPLFVGLLKLLSFGIPRVEMVFFAAALLMSVASLVLLWMLGEQMLGSRLGLVAALLLLWNPPFWFSALTNPVRLGLSAGAAGVALCLFAALRRQSGHWFVAAAAALGVAAGFRPTLLLEMAPLMLWGAVSLRLRAKIASAAVAAFSLGVLVWFPFLVIASGGLVRFWRLLQDYSFDVARTTSFLGGASTSAALHMAAQAVVWSCLGVLSWIWAVPWAVRRNPAIARDTQVNRFLMLWFVPCLVFSAVYHVGDPDQTLSIVPVTCLIGARVLSSFANRASRRAPAVVVAVALCLNLFLFFKPISKIAKASTYPTVSLFERYTASMIEGAGRVWDTDGVTVIFPTGLGVWRNVSYYLPASRVMVVNDRPGLPLVYLVHARLGLVSTPSRDAIGIPTCGVIALADRLASPLDGRGAPVPLAKDPYFSYFPAAPGLSFRSHGFRFVSQSALCPGRAADAALPATVGAPPLDAEIPISAIPHFAAGGSYVTGLYAFNTGNQPARFSIRFYGDEGKPVRLPIRGLGELSTLSDTLPANSSMYFEVGKPDSKVVTTGSAIIQSDPSVTIQALLRHQAPGTARFETAVLTTPGARESEIGFDNTSFPPSGTPVLTGIAVANLDPAHSATVTCTARNSLGNVIPGAVSVPVLNPRGHWAGSDFTALTGLRGTVDCVSNTRIGVVALRAEGTGAISSLPVVTK